MSIKTLHFTSEAYGLHTPCGRQIEKVPSWDDYDAVTCKTCRKIHDREQEMATGEPLTSANTTVLEHQAEDQAVVADKNYSVRPTTRTERVTALSRLDRMRYLADTARTIDPSDKLARLAEIREECELAIAEVVSSLRTAEATWSEIGTILGVKKQAAQQRYGKKPTGPDPDRETTLPGL